MTPRHLGAALLLALLTACGGTPAPVTRPTTPPPAPSPATSATPSLRATTAPQPELPPVQDASGLTGERLVAARVPPLPGAEADGTARLMAGGRAYLLGPARRVAAGTPPALVMLLPAANTNLRTEYDRYGLDALRDHGAAVVVVGTEGASWNAGSCCGKPHRLGVDDVAVVTAVRDDALRRTGADAKRVALFGHSVGALMAWRMACEPEFGAAAAIAISGTLVHPCTGPLARVPDVLALHGAEDASVPLQGSSKVVPLLGIAPPAVPEIASQVATSADCQAPRQASGSTTWTGCAGGGSITLTVLPGRGHAWADLDATRRVSQFLSSVLTDVR